MMENQRISISLAVKNYEAIKALNDVSFSVDAGECVALVGPNGAGKSTLFKLILGLIPLTSGQITVLGLEPGSPGFDTIRKNIGFYPSRFCFKAR